MWNKNIILVSVVAIASYQTAAAQCSPCKDRLQEAIDYYNLGQLSKVTEIGECSLLECLETTGSDGLSKEKKIEGYELLTEAYLMNNEIEKADSQYQNILRYNPLYQVDTSEDSKSTYDLIYLSRTYRRKPVISVYGSIGLNYSRLEILQYYGIDNTGDPSQDFNQPTVGLNGAIGFEVPLPLPDKYPVDFVMEATFAQRTYRMLDSIYSNPYVEDPRQLSGGASSINSTVISSVGADEALRYGTTTFKENQSWIDVPLMFRYNFGEKQIIPYLYVGVGNHFLISSSLAKQTRRITVEEPTGGNQVEEQATERIRLTRYTDKDNGREYQSLRNWYNVSAIGGAGVKIRMERNFLFFDFRYNRMFLNNVNRENRYERPELLYRFMHVDNDFRMDNFSLTVGFMKSFYVPKKKRAYSDKVIELKLNRLIEKERRAMNQVQNQEVRDYMEGNIRNLESRKRSIINDVRSGVRSGKESIQKAENIMKGTN